MGWEKVKIGWDEPDEAELPEDNRTGSLNEKSIFWDTAALVVVVVAAAAKDFFGEENDDMAP